MRGWVRHDGFGVRAWGDWVKALLACLLRAKPPDRPREYPITRLSSPLQWTKLAGNGELGGLNLTSCTLNTLETRQRKNEIHHPSILPELIL